MDVTTRNLTLNLNAERSCRLIDLNFASGEKILISGPSGCGKTTLLHVLGLLRAPGDGSIEIGKQSPGLSVAFRRQNFGFIFQRLSLIDHLTVDENIQLDQISNIDMGLLESLGLNDLRGERVEVLSLGEQQRVAIARALNKKPSVLFADEPTSSLDHPFADAVGALLRKSRSTVIAVSHDERIHKYFDRVLSWTELAR